MEVINIPRISSGERLMKDLASILVDLSAGKLPSVQSSSAFHILYCPGLKLLLAMLNQDDKYDPGSHSYFNFTC